MADFETEASAEDFLINAIAGNGEQKPPAQAQQEAEAEEDDETQGAANETEVEEEEADPKQAKAKEEEQEAPEEDEIEIPGEDGKEPTRVKVADVLRKAQEFDRFEAQKAEIVERIEREATTQATGRLKQIEDAGTQTAYMIQAALQLLQAPQEPNPDMLDPSSQNYNPERYHQMYAQFRRASGQHSQALQLGQQLFAQAQGAAAKAKDDREAGELQKLLKAWPEFREEATQSKFIGDMGREYGFSAQELDEVLVDHRQAQVARDALAFRAMKAKSGDVKAKVEAKAPKLVRSKQEAKGGAQARDRDGSGRFVGGALAELKKTNSDDAAARYFASLSKAGRI